MLKILLIGSGAREHAIARAIKRATTPTQLYYCGPTVNLGIDKLAQDFRQTSFIEHEALTKIVTYATSNNIDYAIVGPELPLAGGIVDLLHNAKIKTIGPTQQLAQIETSKIFARELLKNIYPQALPRYQTFTDLTNVNECLEKLANNYVIKANGLMSGKGVKVFGEHLFNNADAITFCQEIIAKGQSFIIEEKFIGEEFSLLSFSDGNTLVHMPPVQDHKRAFADDCGPNTGGMGSYTDANHLLPFLTAQDVAAAAQLNEIAIAALQKKFASSYKGIIYGGYMLTSDGIKLIEFNARFGDPEAINLLALLETDFISIMQAIVAGTLSNMKVTFKNSASVCKYVVPNGYPENNITAKPISLEQVFDDENLYYAQVSKNDEGFITGTSRAVAILGVADNISSATKQAQQILNKISGEVFYRHDIGTPALINKRINNINKICHRHMQLC